LTTYCNTIRSQVGYGRGHTFLFSLSLKSIFTDFFLQPLHEMHTGPTGNLRWHRQRADGLQETPTMSGKIFGKVPNPVCPHSVQPNRLVSLQQKPSRKSSKKSNRKFSIFPSNSIPCNLGFNGVPESETVSGSERFSKTVPLLPRTESSPVTIFTSKMA